MNLNKIRILKTEGSNYKIGKAIGKAQKENIKFLISRLIIKKEIINKAKKALQRHEKYFPKYVEELKGIAYSTNIDFTKLFAFCCFEDSCRFRSHEEKCTTLFWSGNKEAFIGHNEEEFAINYRKLIVVKAKLDNGISFLTLNYPGILCGDTISVNSYGLVQAVDTIYPKTEYKTGFARCFIGRALLESPSIEYSKKILSLFPNLEGLNVLIYSAKERKYISFETFNKNIAEIQPNNIFAHSNKYLTSEFRKIPQDFPKIAIFKVKHTKHLLKNKGNPSLHKLKCILSDHTNYPLSLCRHPSENDSESTATLSSVIINLKSLSFYVTNGNPCNNKFYRFQL